MLFGSFEMILLFSLLKTLIQYMWHTDECISIVFINKEGTKEIMKDKVKCKDLIFFLLECSFLFLSCNRKQLSTTFQTVLFCFLICWNYWISGACLFFPGKKENKKLLRNLKNVCALYRQVTSPDHSSINLNSKSTWLYPIYWQHRQGKKSEKRKRGHSKCWHYLRKEP